MSEPESRPIEPPPAETPPAPIPPTAPSPRGTLRRLYQEEWRDWTLLYRRPFKHAARALGLGFVAGVLFFMARPDMEAKALEAVMRALRGIPLGAAPLVLALTIFYHNARATLFAVAAGFVPFLRLPILDPLLNGAVLGLLVSVSKHQGLDVPRLVLTQILPHGLFEIPAVLYATSVGMSLSAAMGRKVSAAWKARQKRDVGPPGEEGGVRSTAAEETGSLIRRAVRSLVLVVLPLLLIAGLIEGLITPRLN